MFDQRLNWNGYNTSLLSKGGGVYERSAKTITVSEEAQRLFELPGRNVAPADLMRSILRAKADLLWLGGIGTYVKASDEDHAAARDRANDPLRVNGNELRVRVVGEGANLGFTQKARIEFALGGGKINTDAIDNSAGVDTSDHEVNIKILLYDAIEHGELGDIDERNKVLAQMTDEVGAPRPARQLRADAGHLDHAHARRVDARRAGALHARAGARRQARSRHRVSARRRDDRRASCRASRSDASGDRHPAGVQQDLRLPGPAGVGSSGRSASRPGPAALLPARAAQALPGRDRPASSAPRDHRHVRHEQHAQPRAADVRLAGGGRDRQAGQRCRARVHDHPRLV